MKPIKCTYMKGTRLNEINKLGTSRYSSLFQEVKANVNGPHLQMLISSCNHYFVI